jgi:Ni,Fe-hydrogenase III component G
MRNIIAEFDDIIQKEKNIWKENIKNRISEKLMNKTFSLENEDKKLFSLLCCDQSGDFKSLWFACKDYVPK